MATANLNRDKVVVDDGNDSIVIVNDLGDIPGGRTLDVSSVASGTNVIRAGHIVITKSNGEYAPLGVSDGAYASLSNGEAYAGVLKHSVTVEDPRAAILTIGQVNAAASPYPVTDTIKSGLPRIQFLY